jgi:hypothetical protein
VVGYTPIIPAFRKQRQEDYKFEDSLGWPFLKQKKKPKKKKKRRRRKKKKKKAKCGPEQFSLTCLMHCLFSSWEFAVLVFSQILTELLHILLQFECGLFQQNSC